MRLTDLQPQFRAIRHEAVDPDVFVDGVKHPSGDREFHVAVDTLAEAQFVDYLCPVCFLANGNSDVGTHRMMTPFANHGFPEGEYPGMHRWDVSGTGYDDLTTTPSILSKGGCNAHYFITNGEILIV